MTKYRAKIDYRLAEELKYDPYVASKYMFKPPSYWDRNNFITQYFTENVEKTVDF